MSGGEIATPMLHYIVLNVGQKDESQTKIRIRREVLLGTMAR